MYRTPVWIALAWLATGASLSHAATQDQIDQAWNKGVAWLLLNQHGDGGWSSALSDGNATRQGLGIQATAAAVETLSSMGIKTGYTYLGGVAWLGNAESASVDALARQIIALQPSGEDLAPMGSRLLAWRNRMNGWGAYEKHALGIVDTALGVRAMLDINSGYGVAGNVVCSLLTSQHTTAPNYGWSFTVPATNIPASQSTASITATVNAAMALYRWRGQTGSATCGTTTYSFATVFDNATSWLLTKRNADNGFGDTGASGVLESALVLRLFKTISPSNPATQTTIDYLIAQQSANGSWSAGDALQTAEVLAALSSASTVEGQRPSSTLATDTDKDGVPGGVETVMGTNPLVADSRFLAKGSGPAANQPAVVLAAASVESAVPAAAAASVEGLDGVSEVWNKPVDLEVFLAGTSAQLPVLEQVMERLLQDGTLEILTDDGGVRGASSGASYRAYYGATVADDRKVLIHFSTDGGSESGVAAVARAAPVDRMVVDQDCIRGGAGERWSCPLQHRAAQVPDAGLSEVQPGWDGSGSSTEAALTTDELAGLDAVPIHAMAFGVGATDALRNAGLGNLSQADLGRLITGQIRTDWSAVDPALPAQPVIVCRLAKGAQPAAEALILGTGCDSAVASAAPAATSATDELAAPGYLIVENASTDELAACLDRAETGGVMHVNGTDISVRPGSFAIGLLGAERIPQGTERWGYIDLDGAAPERNTLVQGEYTHYAEAWMQWRNTTVNDVPAVSGEQLALLQALRAMLADPLALGDARATAALGGTSGGMPTTRNGDVCAAPVSVN